MVKLEPPVAAVYHFKSVPEASKLATVEVELNVCEDAIGAGVTLTVTKTEVLALLSQELRV